MTSRPVTRRVRLRASSTRIKIVFLTRMPKSLTKVWPEASALLPNIAVPSLLLCANRAQEVVVRGVVRLLQVLTTKGLLVVSVCLTNRPVHDLVLLMRHPVILLRSQSRGLKRSLL